MDETPNLTLPYIMAAQAQKHITHNEAIRTLDAIVQLSVLDNDQSNPPATPVDGDRYIIASAASGDWSGKENQIAAFQDNAWIYYHPSEGWLAWLANEDKLLVFDGAAWNEVSGSGSGGSGSVNPTPLVGVNATADATNRLSVSSSNALFDHEGSDHRVKINKATSADTASIVFQDNYDGHAEIGLMGDDDFHFKLSSDGSNWHESILLDKNDGTVTFPQGIASIAGGPVAGFRNYIINGQLTINQRAFSGALSAGVYGYDRWKAGSGGANISVNNGIISLSSGSITQVIEAPALAGKTVTISVADLTAGNLNIDIESQTGTIIAGTGRTGVSVTIPAGSTGNITVTLSIASGGVTFRDVQLEQGFAASEYEHRPLGIEEYMCKRYFQFLPTWFGHWWVNFATRMSVSGSFPVQMRATPSLSLLVGTNGVVNPGVAFHNVQSISGALLGVNGGYVDFITSGGAINTPGFATSVLTCTLDSEL